MMWKEMNKYLNNSKMIEIMGDSKKFYDAGCMKDVEEKPYSVVEGYFFTYFYFLCFLYF